MKDLWSGHNRARHEQFKHLTLEDVYRLLKKLSEIFAQYGPTIYKTNIILAGRMPDKKDFKKFDMLIKNDAYILLVMLTMDSITGQGGEPVFMFDAEKDTKSERIIQQWAADAFSKGCKNVLYAFMSHGIPTEEPVFVPPASRPLLELADVLSFVVARYNHKLFLKQRPDIDCSMFGSVGWTFEGGGDTLISRTANAYPWNVFQ